MRGPCCAPGPSSRVLPAALGQIKSVGRLLLAQLRKTLVMIALHARSPILKTINCGADRRLTERAKKGQLIFAALNLYGAQKKSVIGESKGICEQADRVHSQYRNRVPPEATWSASLPA